LILEKGHILLIYNIAAVDFYCVFVKCLAIKLAVFLLNLPVDFIQYRQKTIFQLCLRLICCDYSLQILAVLRSDKFALRLHVEKLCRSEIDVL